MGFLQFDAFRLCRETNEKLSWEELPICLLQSFVSLPIKTHDHPLPVWLSWLEHCPIHQKTGGLIPGQGTRLGCAFDLWSISDTQKNGIVSQTTSSFSLTISNFCPSLFHLSLSSCLFWLEYFKANPKQSIIVPVILSMYF
ncbi:hypothetical protein HJG60_009296 [Phyllostomus discolor]|uniref:Uncharacterized protein n=1 Tax=Phyllostomus discolor TaxID=89673 RepID=A0A833YJF6_9CHIR|nr:hypothetical protein HJG60_009296 [Phyllostomus discolor]